MPTNFLRRPATSIPNAATDKRAPTNKPLTTRIVRIKIGRHCVRAQLYDTATAERLWTTLPYCGVAETWGQSIHFETRSETGRERGAVLNARPGELYFWAEDGRIIIPFGPTPISRPGEMRLPRPCNPIATALDDLSVLNDVVPGEKVVMERAPSKAAK